MSVECSGSLRKTSLIVLLTWFAGCAGTVNIARPERAPWVSGQPIYVDASHTRRLTENLPANVTEGVRSRLRDELSDLGFTPADDPNGAVAVVSIDGVDRNEIHATLRVAGRVEETYDSNVGGCTSVWWGVEEVADTNMKCLARGVSAKLMSSPKFEQLVASAKGPAPAVASSTAPPPQAPTPAPAPESPAPHARPTNQGLVALIPLDVRDARMDAATKRGLEESIRTVAGDILSPLGYTVLTGETTLAVLADNGVDASQACDTTCALATARELKAKVFLSGMVSQSEGEYLGFIRIYEIKTGRQLGSVELEGATVRELRKQFEAKAQHAFEIAMAALQR